MLEDYLRKFLEGSVFPNCFGAVRSYLLTHLFPMHPFSTPWKHQKTLSFSDLFRGREKVHWEQVGEGGECISVLFNTFVHFRLVDLSFNIYFHLDDPLVDKWRCLEEIFYVDLGRTTLSSRYVSHLPSALSESFCQYLAVGLNWL